MTFLQKTAQHIFAQHSINTLQKLCIVLPTRRAVYYFKHALAQLSNQPFLAPEIWAVDDFFMKFSGKTLIDPIDLLFQLYDVFKEIDPQVSLEKFAVWAPTLLKDFDTIDLYLVNAQEIFAYMSESRMIEKWDLELQDTAKAKIEKTDRMDKFFKLYENLNIVYENLHKQLINSHLAYRGMAYRAVADNIETLLLTNNEYEKYYFIGFNALSASEEKVIETLVKAQKAETLWDSDAYYMNEENKAGYFLESYRINSKFGTWNWLENDLLSTEKNINIIAVQNNTLQAKVAGQLYSNMLQTIPQPETAIVLADEQLLLPVMYALADEVQDFNITMGLSLRNSMLFSFIDSIFELHQNMVEFKNKAGEKIMVPKFSHRHISKVLNHPFVRRYETSNFNYDSPIRKLLSEIQKHNLVFLSEKEILELSDENTLIKTIFHRWKNDPSIAIQCFQALVTTLRELYDEQQDAIELEYIFMFYTILNRLEKIMYSRKDMKLKSFKIFLYEFIKQSKIPFSGEPIAQLQIMGMLETRCLDFERLIILSVNEGKLPAGKKLNSLIPLDALRALGLPVYSQQDAIMAYHFFRLLQRAKSIDILYVSAGSDGIGGGGEKSRFIQQIERDFRPENSKINLKNFIVETAISTEEKTNFSQESKIYIVKNEAILTKLSNFLAEKGIYPSHLNQYVACSLQFYFSQVAKIAEPTEINEKLGADVFGNWIHKTLENIDKTYANNGTDLTEADAQQIIVGIPKILQQVYEQDIKGYIMDSGMNYLLGKIAEKLLIDFYKEQIRNKAFPMKILSVEKKIEVSFETIIHGKTQKIAVAGRIDRIELKGNVLSVVDYKTGKVFKKDLELEKEQTWHHALLIDTNKAKLRQLWLYQYLILKQLEEGKGVILSNIAVEANTTINTKIYSFRNLKEKLEKRIELFDNESIEIDFNADFIQESEYLLGLFADDLLNPELTFEQTENLEICKLCDFKGICGR